MGLFSTIGSFAAGYLVGARRRTPVSPATALPPFDTRRVSEIMTSSPKTLPSDATLSAAAKIMEADDIGDVIVTDPASNAVIGIITDRDIVIRAIAKDLDPASTPDRFIVLAERRFDLPARPGAGSIVRHARRRRAPATGH